MHCYLDYYIFVDCSFFDSYFDIGFAPVVVVFLLAVDHLFFLYCTDYIGRFVAFDNFVFDIADFHKSSFDNFVPSIVVDYIDNLDYMSCMNFAPDKTVLGTYYHHNVHNLIYDFHTVLFDDIAHYCCHNHFFC